MIKPIYDIINIINYGAEHNWVNTSNSKSQWDYL